MDKELTHVSDNEQRMPMKYNKTRGQFNFSSSVKITEELRLSNRYRSRHTCFDNGLSRLCVSLDDSRFNSHRTLRTSFNVNVLRCTFTQDSLDHLCVKLKRIERDARFSVSKFTLRSDEYKFHHTRWLLNDEHVPRTASIFRK